MLKSVWWWVGARTVGSVGKCKLGHMNVSLSLKLECCGTRAEAAEAAAARLSAMPLRARLGLWAGFAACRCAPTYLGRRAGSCRRPWQKQPARTPSARTAVGQTASCPAKEHKYTDQQARPAPTHGNLPPLSRRALACTVDWLYFMRRPPVTVRRMVMLTERAALDSLRRACWAGVRMWEKASTEMMGATDMMVSMPKPSAAGVGSRGRCQVPRGMRWACRARKERASRGTAACAGRREPSGLQFAAVPGHHALPQRPAAAHLSPRPWRSRCRLPAQRAR